MVHNAYTMPFRWNLTVWAITLGCTALCVAAFGAMIYCATVVHRIDYAVAGFVVFALLLAAIVLAEGYAPQRLEVGDDGMVILRRYRSIEIPRSEIVGIEPVATKYVLQSFRLGGSGGLFGFFGRHYSPRLGGFDLYATEFRNMMIIRTARKTFIVGCTEPRALHERLC